MKATYTQIENAINNNYDFKKGTQEQYEAIRACENEAIERAGIKKKDSILMNLIGKKFILKLKKCWHNGRFNKLERIEWYRRRSETWYFTQYKWLLGKQRRD